MKKTAVSLAALEGEGEGNFTKVYKGTVTKLLKRLTDSEAGVIFRCLSYIRYKVYALVEKSA
ncbi:hypothetical protein GCM10020331_074120 [Ectobacillus funiculus]